MIQFTVFAPDGERIYEIQTPEPKEVIKWMQKYGHEAADYRLVIHNQDGAKDLDMNEMEKWFEDNRQ